MVTFVVLRIVVVVLLVAANAFFVAAEFALVNVRETRLQQMIAAHRMGARTVQKLHQKLDHVLNTVQFGVTVASLALGWLGEASMARILEPLFLPLPHSRFYAHGVSVVVAFVLITYMVVILGEVVPKSIALQRTERVALAVAGPMDFFMTLAAPFLAFMTASTRDRVEGLWHAAGARRRRALAGGAETDCLRQPPAGNARRRRRRN